MKRIIVFAENLEDFQTAVFKIAIAEFNDFSFRDISDIEKYVESLDFDFGKTYQMKFYTQTVVFELMKIDDEILKQKKHKYIILNTIESKE